jgi:anti-sigma regulatory factor (Ser/Thr protein kinase)
MQARRALGTMAYGLGGDGRRCFGRRTTGNRLVTERTGVQVRRAQPSRSPAADGYQLVLTAPFQAGDMAAVRRRIDAAAREAGLPPHAAEGLTIAANEIMTNAVRHGGGSGLLRLWAAADVLCEITDGGSGFATAAFQDRREQPKPTASGGMGLWIAQRTTDGLSIGSGPAGTAVRLVVRRPVDPPR